MLRSDMVGKAAVHFLVNMLEAYYFADAEAVNSVLGTKLQDFDGVADRRPARQHLGWVRGCRAGTDAKYTLICDEYGFAGAINYKSENTSERLRALCPEGVNVYFDNVAGSTLDAVLENMAVFGTVAVCGLIANYGSVERLPGPMNYDLVLMKRLRIEGFFITRLLSSGA